MARNPFRSEAEAYNFLLVLVGYFAAIVAAKVLIGNWAALIVFAVLGAVVLWWIFRTAPREGPERITAAHRGGPNERRILVVAPALNSPLRHWASDDDGARVAARERLERSLERLREAGFDADGTLGDSEPVQAIEDALRTFGADEIVISTHPEGRSHWLERGVVEAARARFDVPITHVVVDLAAEREEVR